MFIHSLIFTILLIWYAQYFLDNIYINQFLEQWMQFLSAGSGWFIALLIVGIILAIWYWILPPIWEAAMIIFRHEWRNEWTVSLSKGFNKFFPMFEFHAATGLFEIYVILFALIRAYTLGILSSRLVIMIMIIWLSITIFVQIFFAYSKMYITIDNYNFFEAMKESTRLAMRNLWITIKFSLLTAILSIRFIINLLILVGVPLGIIYVGTLLGLDSFLLLKGAFIGGIVLLIMFVAYVEWIIEAFFITCWRKVRKRIKHTNEEAKGS